MDSGRTTMDVAHRATGEVSAGGHEPSGQRGRSLEPKGAGAPASAAAHMIPMPVEVQSVPETPVNTASPVGGTPRAELDLSRTEDEAEKAQAGREDEGVIERLATPPASARDTDEPMSDDPMTDDAAAAGQNGGSGRASAGSGSRTAGADGAAEKRKLEDEARHRDEQVPGSQEEHERAEKKAKNGDGLAKGRPGRPKKNKSAPPAVGRAARKTRSQGPAEA